MYPLSLIIHKAAKLRNDDFINEEGDISCIIENSASCSGFTRTRRRMPDGQRERGGGEKKETADKEGTKLTSATGKMID